MWLFCRVGSSRLSSFPRRFTGSPVVVLRSVMDRASLFQSIGLSEQKTQETLKNEALSTRLESIINLVRTYNLVHFFDFCTQQVNAKLISNFCCNRKKFCEKIWRGLYATPLWK